MSSQNLLFGGDFNIFNLLVKLATSQINSQQEVVNYLLQQMMELHQNDQTFEEQAVNSLQHAFVVESNKTFTN